jgi:hypothetical protein
MTRMSNDCHREQDHKFDDTIPPRAYGLELEPEIVWHYSIFQRRLYYTKGLSSTRPDTHDLMTLSHLAMYVLAGLTEDGFVHAMQPVIAMTRFEFLVLSCLHPTVHGCPVNVRLFPSFCSQLEP